MYLDESFKLLAIAMSGDNRSAAMGYLGCEIAKR